MEGAIHSRDKPPNSLTWARNNGPCPLILSNLIVIIIIIIRLSISQTRKMSSYPEDAGNEKFGRLPLSNSGPEECALTVHHNASI